MNQEKLANQTVRVNCNISGDAAKILNELKKRGVVQSNREAVVQGLITLQEKVTKLDMEKAKIKDLAEQKIYLKPWEEIIGTLTGIENDDSEITALLTCNYQKRIAITLPKDQPEPQELRKLLGQKIAILKTDNPAKPIIIRTYREPTATQNDLSVKLWFRRRMLTVLRGSVFSERFWCTEERLR